MAQTAAEASAPEEEAVDPEAIAQEQVAIERHHQLAIHQVLGLTTLGAMAGTWLGGRLIESGAMPRGLHAAAGGLTAGLYLTTAGLALLSPPAPLTAQVPPGWDSITLHRGLAWVHAAGMVGTVGLGVSSLLGGTTNPQLHGLLGLSSTVLMTLSAGGIILAP